MTTVLIANRGEIAARIAQTARNLGYGTVAVYTAEDAGSTHVRAADTAVGLSGRGVAGYLNQAELIQIAQDAGASLVHPGYGFLAESADFASAVTAAGLVFVGPDPATLEICGDKAATKALAQRLGIPVIRSTGVLEDAGQAADFLAEAPGAIALKAVAGGGGRGIHIVHTPAEVPAAFERSRSEARAGFGDDRVFAEDWAENVKHIEVQILGAQNSIWVLGDRDCSVQRRRQKILEIAPADLSPALREQLHEAARLIASELDYRTLATVEFLVADEHWHLLEINPRIQVEHTVTEQVTGLDLAALQFGAVTGELAAVSRGRLAEFAAHGPQQTGCAIQARINAETLNADGVVKPAVGTIESVDVPTGPSVRVDSWIASGTQVGAAFDSLLAKVIATGANQAASLRTLRHALSTLQVNGVDTNAGLLQSLLDDIDIFAADTQTFDEWIADNSGHLAAAAQSPAAKPAGNSATGTQAAGTSAAVLPGAAAPAPSQPDLHPGEEVICAPYTGTIVSVDVKGRELALIEALKMHHPVTAPAFSSVRHLVDVGDTVVEGQPIAAVTRTADSASDQAEQHRKPHPGITEIADRHAATLDEHRPNAVAKVHTRGRRTARENLADLVVPGTFVEYGSLALAAQRARRSLEELIERTPADGLVGGIGEIETAHGRVTAVIMSYDYMVVAGTQGARNHAKTDRLLDVAKKRSLPVVFFTEGGGGRPGDTDISPGTKLNVTSFAQLAGLRGQVPLIAVASGRTFAGNAAFAGVCDVIIATAEANIGMGGPAMIEGGGLGRFAAEEVGPVHVHARTGAVDRVVADDAAAVAEVKKILGYAVGGAANGCEGARSKVDPRVTVPADRLRAFDMREVIASVVDQESFLEMRADYAPGAIVGFARVAGRPCALIANNNAHLSGAIDVDAARSFTQHMRLAQDYGLPLVSFVDTPGFIVGPEAEKQPGVRAFGDLYVAGAQLTIPLGTVVIRKAYGLGAMAMTAGHLHAPQFTVSWPSGEMGPMGLEGAVRLGYAKELAALEGAAQEKLYRQLLDELYEQGRALAAAEVFDIDDVIDPADTRTWISTLF